MQTWISAEYAREYIARHWQNEFGNNSGQQVENEMADIIVKIRTDRNRMRFDEESCHIVSRSLQQMFSGSQLNMRQQLVVQTWLHAE